MEWNKFVDLSDLWYSCQYPMFKKKKSIAGLPFCDSKAHAQTVR